MLLYGLLIEWAEPRSARAPGVTQSVARNFAAGPVAAALLFATLLAVGGAQAQEKQARETQNQQTRIQESRVQEGDRLEQIERSLEADRHRIETLKNRAAALAGEIAALQAEMVAAAAAAQDYEEELSALEERLAAVEEEEREKSADLSRHRSQLSQALGALQRLSLQPPEALILGPETPVDMVRSAMLLKVALPELQTRARSLREELGTLRSLREKAERQREKVAAAAAALEAENRRIAALIERKNALRRTTAKDEAAAAERVAALAREAEDLRDLIARLAANPPPVKPSQTAMLVPPPVVPPVRPTPDAPEPAATMRLQPPETIRTFPAKQASLTMPARGDLVSRFDETSSVGLTSKGIRIATREQAQVVAPYDGQIVFRGPFRGYGEILIIEHRGGYHSLLVGLGRTDAVVGQWLLAGEPVGIMGPAMDGTPELYLELRHGGEPIDPLPWLKTRDSEVE